MKKFLLLSTVTIFAFSCGADQATVDKMAGEMCSAMELYKNDNPMSMLEAAGKMSEIAGKEDEYSGVTEGQLKGAMETKCPEGYEKFQTMIGG
jgi:hypothetical protein